jgi:hypothetical protein
MNVTIKTVSNGLILTHKIEDETAQEVFEYSDNEVDKFAEFLYRLSDLIGPSTGRHDAKRIYIKVAPGDKYLDTLTESEQEAVIE